MNRSRAVTGAILAIVVCLVLQSSVDAQILFEAERSPIRSLIFDTANNDALVLESAPLHFREQNPSLQLAVANDTALNAFSVGHENGSKDSMTKGNSKADPCYGPEWMYRGGALFMQRGTPDSSVLLFDTAAPANNINANEFGFDFETGWEVSAIRDCGDRGWEIRYMSVDGWNATSNLTAGAPTLIQINNAPASFLPGTTTVNATYSSELLGGELNRRRRFNDCVTVFAGFRYIELDEHVHLDADTAVLPSTYDAFTANRLYGGQLGLEANLWCRNRLTVEGVGKVGVYYNDSGQFSALDTGAVVFSAGATSERAAFAAELGLAGSYCLTDNLSLRASYNLLFIDSVALATDQIPATNIIMGTGISSSGDVFYHGAMVGLEYRR